MAPILPRSQNRTERRRGCTYRDLCLTLICLLVIGLIAVGLGFGIPAILKMKDHPENPPIQPVIKRIVATVDSSQDPCVDFYEYACGNYDNNIPIPVGEISIDIPKEIQLKTKAQLVEIYSIPKRPNEAPVYHKVKDFYAACMDTDSIERVKTEPLKIVINRVGGWPLVRGSAWDESKNKDWIDLHVNLYKAGIVPDQILSFTVMADLFVANKSVLHIYETEQLGLPLTVFSTPQYSPLLSFYRDLMLRYAHYLGANSDTVEDEVTDMFNFEIELARILHETKKVDRTYKQLTIKELEAKFPQVRWLKFINAALPYVVDESEKIVINSETLLREFSSYISTVPIRTFTNYMIWRVVLLNSQLLDMATKKIFDDFARKYFNQSPAPREEKCEDETTYYMATGASLLYVKHNINHQIKPAVEKLVEDVRRQFLVEVEQMQWMDNVTKQVAMEKVKAIEFRIGYPESYFDKEQIHGLYENLVINNRTYFNNMLTTKLLLHNDKMLLLKETFDTEWSINADVTQVKATYLLLDNTVIITYAFLQPMFYELDAPMTFNYGALGSVIAHEFFHAIDKKGSQHSKDGVKLSWWTQPSTNNFIAASQCFIEKYNSFVEPITAKNVNGDNTFKENVADYVGVKTSYAAHNKFVQQNNHQVDRLPNKILPWTHQQLFWLSYANMYCERIREDKQRSDLDVHSPNKFRVIGPLSSLPEFHKDFNCKQTTEETDSCTL